MAAQRAGIKKKVNPHSFRHARATYLAGRFTEQQLKAFFGWTRSSDATTVYVHLSGKDVDDALLKAYGIKTEESSCDITTLKPVNCKRCKTQNESANSFCKLCGFPLNEDVAIKVLMEDTKKKDVGVFMDNFIDDPDFKELFAKKFKAYSQ